MTTPDKGTQPAPVPALAEWAREIENITAEFELATARRRMGYVGEAVRGGEDVRHFVEEIYEAVIAGMPVTEIAHELNCGEGALREIGNTYGYHTWAVDVLRDGTWREVGAGEDVWRRERIAEYAAEVLDETLDRVARGPIPRAVRWTPQDAPHGRVRVWLGSNPARTGQPAHVAYTHDEDAG